MIRPQVPLRTPCYNLAPLAKSRIVALRREQLIRTLLGWLDGRCVQGAGTYSPRDSDARLLGIPSVHEAEFQAPIWTGVRFRGLPSPFGVGTHCPNHCRPRVAQEIRAIQIYRWPLLPQYYYCSPIRVLLPLRTRLQLMMWVSPVTWVNRTLHSTSWRWPYNTSQRVR